VTPAAGDVLAGAAAFAGGAVNALAGGGTLITFPVLIALGVPPVAANVTNTIALCPGYAGGILAQAKDLEGQGSRLRLFLPVALGGGIAGAVLLLHTEEAAFRRLVPFLILLAAGLLAVQERLRRFLAGRSRVGVASRTLPAAAAAAVLAASVYGGYFGAGSSVIVLAALGLTLPDDLTRLNGLKQAISLAANAAAAVVFCGSHHVVWRLAAVMAAGALVGGATGGKLARTIAPEALRRVVVTVGLVVGIIYLVR
jgi:uncharacterized membrane protein YfcA